MNRGERRAAAAKAHTDTGMLKTEIHAVLQDGEDVVLQQAKDNQVIVSATTHDERARLDEAVGIEVKGIIARLVKHVGPDKVDGLIEARLKTILRSDFVDVQTRSTLKDYIAMVVDEQLDNVEEEIETRVKSIVAQTLDGLVQKAVQAATQTALAEVKKKMGITLPAAGQPLALTVLPSVVDDRCSAVHAPVHETQERRRPCLRLPVRTGSERGAGGALR